MTNREDVLLCTVLDGASAADLHTIVQAIRDSGYTVEEDLDECRIEVKREI